MTTATIDAWNLMGGEVDGTLLGPVAEILGVDDPGLLLRGLVQIRDHFREQEKSRR